MCIGNKIVLIHIPGDYAELNSGNGSILTAVLEMS